MISRIHSKLGTAGLVVAIVALVVALTGVAFAATGLNSKQKKEVKKIAKQFAGKNGAPGATGSQGAKGDTGATGPAGKDGTNGTNGTNGQSVTGAPINTGGACGPQTGVKYTLGATSTNVCNGATGFTETLPSGKTETGTWALGPFDKSAFVPLTFNIPLGTAPAFHFVNAEGEEISGEEPFHEAEDCTGTAEDPTASPGDLCIYGYFEEGEGATGNAQTFTSGAAFLYSITEGQVSFGTFAVTAE